MAEMFDTCAIPPPPLMQSVEFAAALRASGHRPRSLADGALVLHRRLAAGLTVAMLPRGRSEPAALPGLLREAGLMRTPLILNPDRPMPDLARCGAVPLVTPATVAELDLSGDLRAGLRQKWRNRLTRAQALGLRTTLQALPDRPGQWLLQADLQQQAARGYRNWPVDLTLAYARENPGNAKLFTAFDRHVPVAALLILCHGGAASYHIGHSTARGRACNAQTLLMWQAMTWLARKGYRRLDLGPVETEDNPGLARFKLGTGARARRLGGTWLWWPVLGRALAPLAKLDRARME